MAFKVLWATLLPALFTLASAHEKGSAMYRPMTTVTRGGQALTPTPTALSFLARRADTSSAVAPSASAYALSSSFSINSNAATRTYDWTIASETGAPDGFTRNYITINGQMPGPLIEVNEGDTIVVNVQNNLDDTTSIHWHGINQNGTAYMDGVPGATQCPIPAGGSFTYTFTLSQYGTYWYHSHTAVEYTDGLLGPLIVHSVNDPLVRGTDFDYEQVLIIQDWYHDEARTIATDLLSVDGYDGTAAAPSPQSGLINGKGVFDCSQLTDSTGCSTPSFPEFTVEPNAKTRFRLINGGSHAQFYFSVDSHTLNITEADGTPVSGASSVHRLPFHNGQRYSAIIDTNVGSAGDAYWLRATMNTDCFFSTDSTLNTTAYAILRYGASTSEPTSADWTDVLPDDCVDLDDSQLVPIIAKDAPATSDKVVAFDSSFGTVEIAGIDYNRFLVNSTSYTNYVYKPILEAVAANGSTVVNSTNVANALFEDSVWTGDIIINNLDPNLDHPYHLHGNDFQIIARGTGTLSIANAASLNYNLTNPVRRDTVVIPGGGYAVLRFSNDNPGVWVLHCHIAWHLAEGFLGLIVSNPNGIAALDYPDSIQALCNARPSGVSIDTTEPGRRKRGEIDTLIGGDIVKRGAMGSRWSRKRMINQRR
ncbi:multicopper oxidase [Heterobasidion irregulare TC 32-1]|uniref:Multicopper oxidase n=1 Tax=Heterobasidion irregulare (strain TC 32-1) TaxID=747525 RepID=W4KBR7_HETIT|nr:multicopper oxidase [Heterobasidion irregulare TC 32-1]ETW83287.1 multicopper oxidase [Heterobasidion irregulare TC 32-1]